MVEVNFRASNSPVIGMADACCWRAPSIFLQSSFHSNVVHVVHTSQNER